MNCGNGNICHSDVSLSVLESVRFSVKVFQGRSYVFEL